MIVTHICSIANICYVFLYTFYRNFRQEIYNILICIFFKKHTPYVLLPCYKNFGMVISILLSYYIKIEYIYMIHSIHSLLYHQFYYLLLLKFLNTLFPPDLLFLLDISYIHLLLFLLLYYG